MLAKLGERSETRPMRTLSSSSPINGLARYRVLEFGDMRQNLGKLDRTFRFVLAIWLLGPWAPYFHQTWLQWLVTLIGIIALIESFTAFCPAHDWLGIDNKHQ